MIRLSSGGNVTLVWECFGNANLKNHLDRIDYSGNYNSQCDFNLVVKDECGVYIFVCLPAYLLKMQSV